jgi:hypothetical protein
VIGNGSISASDPHVAIKTVLRCYITVCDVVLVSRHTRAIDRDVVCGLLNECLQDVSFVAFPLLLLVTYYLVSDFLLLLN